MALDDQLVNRLTWKIPNALALIGSRAGIERNAMTASWITQLSMEPVLIGVGVENTAVTHRLISQGGSFTVNLRHAFDLGTHTLFVGELVDGAIHTDEARSASMSDTRMKYGGVKRH